MVSTPNVVEKKKMERVKAYKNIISILHANPILGEVLIQYDLIDRDRIQVLQEILVAIEQQQEDFEWIENKIYQYGSMIRGNHLLARQIFLFLHAYIKEKDRINSFM